MPRNKKLLHATGSKDRETDEKGTRADKKNGGSWSDARREARKKSMKKGPPGSQRLDREAQRVKRRRATLPHPLECSTIAAPGLSYRVRNGTGRLTRAMTTAKPRSRNDSQNKAAIPAIML